MSKPNSQNPLINRTVLMSGADYFSVKELNPYSSTNRQPVVQAAITEHAKIASSLEQSGVTVLRCDAPAGCQDGVYTANWGLCRGDTVLLSSLPKPRQAEEPYAKQVLIDLGKRVIESPYRFSGQGDALPIGSYLLAGSTYRSDPRVHRVISDTLGYEVITLQTVPLLSKTGKPVFNRLTHWPDSFFYDIDLAISILSPSLIAWCPDAFDRKSQAKIRRLKAIDKIEVSYSEAVTGFACNLVSTGTTVVMSDHAPKLKADIESRGLATITPAITELAKGGGYIRCTTLTMDNA